MREWQHGWLQGVRHSPSPNFGPRPEGAKVTLAVVHSISLPPGEYGGGFVEALFANRLDWSAHPYFESIRGLEVSAHFLIDRQGQITQFVSCDARAWHAGRSSFAGQDNCNDFSIGIELEGLEGLNFEEVQYQALIAVVKGLVAKYPIEAMQGHEHIAPGRKADPGAGFDWACLRENAALQALCLPMDEPQKLSKPSDGA